MQTSFLSVGVLLKPGWLLSAVFLITACSAKAVEAAEDSQTRPAHSDSDLERWLQNMAWHHRFTAAEMQQVTGLSSDQLADAMKRFRIDPANPPARDRQKLLVLPYPGGRHPRIGFLEGAIDPQRETKLSVFCPWDLHSYVVMDIPEAIWSDAGLTYLAHTHIDTVWDKQGIRLPKQEWESSEDGQFRMARTLPNGIEFGTVATVHQDHVSMSMWLKNGTSEKLSDLRVQNCVMLRGAAGFDQQTKDNKEFIDGYAVARSADGLRWIISAWTPVHRAWGNPKCPCLHSDPKFPDCLPGETQWLRGWQSFYEGADLAGELRRIEATGWKTVPVVGAP